MKTRTKLPIISLLFIFSISFGIKTYGNPIWQWAKTPMGTSEDRSYNTATDNNNNIYCTGNFKSGPMLFGTTTHSNAGLEDIYVAKFDAAGNYLWSISFGDTSDEMGAAIACDASGDVYVAGTFTSPTVTFGTYTLSNSGMKDIFLVKLNSSGTVLWASAYGGNNDDYAYDLFADANDNVYMTGNFTSPSITFGSTTLIAVGTSKAYVAKFNESGIAQWAAGSRGLSFDSGVASTVDANGNVYFTGMYYDGQAWFDTDTLNNSGDDDFFIVKYNSTGTEQWVKSAGSFNTDRITSVVPGDNGEIYVTGHFFSPFITFDSILINNSGFPGWDMFVTKLDQNGNFIWVKSAITNADEDVIEDIERGSNGKMYVTGWYNGSITLGSNVLTSIGATDIFVAEMDTSSAFSWATTVGSTSQDFTYSLSIDNNNDIYIGGFFDGGTLVFGGSTISTVNAGFNMFLAKLSNVTSVNEIDGNEIDVYPNPVSSFLKINLPHGEFSIELFDLTGKKIFSRQDIDADSKIDFSDIAEGIYELRVLSSKSSYSTKIVVQRD